VINRREVTPEDVEIDILFCGVCHSDLHFTRNDWGMTQYPVVPGHEIVGKVILCFKYSRKSGFSRNRSSIMCRNNHLSDIERINIQDINTAYQRMLKSDVKYRFVIDMKSIKD